MRIIERYLLRELLKAVVMAAAALLALFDLFAFLAEAEDVGDGTYEVSDALLVTLYTTPALLTDLTPFIALLGSVYALSQLTATREVTALRTLAFSRRRIAFLCVFMAMGVSGACLLGDDIGREMYAEASVLRMSETSETGKLIEDSGLWMQRGETYVNVGGLPRAGAPSDIRIFSFTKGGTLETYLHAAQALPLAANRWLLEDVLEKYRDPAHGLATREYPSLAWTPIWDPKAPMYELPIASYSLAELIALTEMEAVVLQPKESLRAELWRRVYLPLTAGAFTLLGASLILRAGPRHGATAGIVVGFALAFVIYVGAELLRNLGIVIGAPPYVTQLFPALLVGAIAAAMMRATE